MKPILRGTTVTAFCPTCGVPTSFEQKGSSFEEKRRLTINGKNYTRVIWFLSSCAVCSRAGVGEIACQHTVGDGELLSFHPRAIGAAKLPNDADAGVVSEFREAEKCLAAEAWRGASALFRSALEKTLRIHGYAEGSLKQRIDAAAEDGVITKARAQKAHDDVRVLGNDVLHDEWRVVAEEEVIEAHHYTQRVIEDFYDDRASVLKILEAKKAKK